MIDSEQIVTAACERVGKDLCGDRSWREGLDVLTASLNDEAGLHELGEPVLAEQLVNHLANRFDVEAWCRAHPEIDEEAVVAPLFGLGLPRTGSTALSFLFASDPSRRSLRSWEAERPCPPPETAHEHDDPRIAVAQAAIDFTNEMFPDFEGMLPTSATGPQECVVVMAQDFRSQMFEMMASIPRYSAWLHACDMRPAYEYHRRVLKLLQWRCPPKQWWLKTPAHMASISALDSVYPDARFVMTHRDVAVVLVSVCALMHALSGPLTDRPDPVALGRFATQLWEESLRRLIDFRDGGNEHRFHDVFFDELQGDPLRTMRRLYADLGDDLTADTERRMTRWWETSAQKRRPATYRAETFALDIDDLRDRFAFYHDRFDIQAEGAPRTP